MTFPTITLGACGPAVSVQGLGCMGMSGVYGAVDREEARATLERALELGVTLFDTADAYGDNEDFLRPFVRAHRNELLIPTKSRSKAATTIPPTSASTTAQATSTRPQT